MDTAEKYMEAASGFEPENNGFAVQFSSNNKELTKASQEKFRQDFHQLVEHGRPWGICSYGLYLALICRVNIHLCIHHEFSPSPMAQQKYKSVEIETTVLAKRAIWGKLKESNHKEK